MSGSAIVVIFDFEAVETRFVTRDHSGLSTPSGWTLFDGAVALSDDGARFDIKAGRLTVGGTSFRIPDVGDQVTAWLTEKDDSLHEIAVVRKIGFEGEAESTYIETRWVYQDVEVSGRAGGGYEIILANALKPASIGLFEDYSDEDYRLDETAHSGGLSTSTTTITLSESPKDIWPEPGLAVLYHKDRKKTELIEYQTIGGTGDKDLQTVTRHKYGVGDVSPADGTSDYTFPETDTEVLSVWAKRGNPVNALLELLTSTSAGTSWAEIVTDPGFEAWGGGVPTNWTLSGSGTAATFSEETADPIKESSSLKIEKLTAASATFYETGLSGFTPGKYYRIHVRAYGDTADDADGLRLRLRNTTQAKDVEDDGETWSTGPEYVEAIEPLLEPECYCVTVLIDATFNVGDSYALYGDVQHLAAGATLWVDELHVEGPFDTAPNGPYDAGDGDGIGVDWTFFHVAEIEGIRDSYYTEPVFGTYDVLSSGTAVLLVEKDPIKDVKRFCENHLLRPFGLFLAVDEKERITVGVYFQSPLQTTTIGDQWLVEKFKASQWKRNYPSRINNVRKLSDWNVAEGEHDFKESQTQPRSVSFYGQAKPVELSGRGCRTGRLGFPDYSSDDDLSKGATKLMLEAANPWSPIKLRAFFEHRELAIGDGVTVNIRQLPNLKTGARGITSNESWTISRRKLVLETDDVLAGVDLELRLRRPVARPAIVAPNSVASTYTAASDNDRAYCYISPDSDPEFANGDEAYTVPP